MKFRVRGLSLIELLVALTIGSLLIIGAVFVYSQSGRTYTISDTVARMQENARYAFSILEPDIQLAGYYGFTNSPDDFKFITGGSTASPIPVSKTRTSSAKLSGLDAAFHACGDNFPVDLIATVEGTNGTYGLACAAQGGGARDDSDTLTIRRASVDAVGATNGRLQLLVSRLSPTNQFIFADGSLPSEPPLEDDLVEVRNLVVRTYYVAKESEFQPGTPALRVKELTAGGFEDRELLAGVEDLQIQFGIDTGDYDGDGNIDPGVDNNGDNIPDAPSGIATRYVNPDDVPSGFQVVAVRVWMLVRAEQPEQGYVDDRKLEYADRSYDAPKDGFRRVLVSRTIQLRNARKF